MSLIAWFPLNGNTINYGTSTTLTPTASNVVYTEGKIGKAMYTGSLTFTADQMKKWIGNTVSIAMWIYTRSDGSYSAGTPFFGYSGMTAPNNRKFTMFHYPNKNALHCSWQHDESNSTYWGCAYNNFFPDNTWVHLCIVQDAANETITVYRNGEQYSVSTVSGLAGFSIKQASSAPIRENINYEHTSDIRIYNHALSAGEVREIANGLFLHYSNPRSGADKIYDTSGYGRHATPTNVTITPGGIVRGDGMLSFTGTGYLLTKNTLPNTELTISTWVMFSNVSATQCLISCRNSVGLGISVFLVGGKLRFDTGTASDQWTTSYSFNTSLHHVVFTKNSTTKKLYVDGVEVQSIASTTAITNLGTHISVGASQSNGSGFGNYLNGHLSDYRIYSTALSLEEVQKLYNVRARYYKNGTIETFNFKETSANYQVTKEGIVRATILNELVTAPDGAKFLKIMHHDNQGGTNMFVKADMGTLGKDFYYKNEDCWSAFGLIDTVNHGTNYEFMIYQYPTRDSTAGIQKFRFVQSVNPYNTTTSPAATYNTDGYNSSSYGGIYLRNGSDALFIGAATWWGALGTFTKFGTGLPGWNGQQIAGLTELFIRVYDDNNIKIFPSMLNVGELKEN